MMSGSQAVTQGCDDIPGVMGSSLLLCPALWWRMGDPSTACDLEWNSEGSISSALLNRWYWLYCLRAWYLIYMTETLWPFYFRETVKATVRISHKGKLLFRGEAAYHNGMRFHGQETGNFHPCWSKQSGHHTWTSLSESLVGCFMLLKLHQQLDDGLESLLGIQREVLQHQLKYFYMLSVSVILQSISDVNCTQGVGFLLIIFYCRIIHIPHSN